VNKVGVHGGASKVPHGEGPDLRRSGDRPAWGGGTRRSGAIV
jgi:hypothetical protein